MGTQPAETEPQEFYAKHKKIYPREVSGRFSRLRVISLLALLGIYYLTPLLQWDGRQAVLFDLPARKFYIFGLTLWPQDFIYLAAILILAGLSLFFFHRAARSRLVWLCLPANRLDRSLPVDGAQDRGQPLQTDETRQGADVSGKIPYQTIEAHGMDNFLALDRPYLRRLFHPHRRAHQQAV